VLLLAWTTGASAQRPEGVYLREGEAPARLELRRAGAGFRVVLAAAAPLAGAATAADCGVEGTGQIGGDMLVGTLATLLPAEPARPLRIRLGEAEAEVLEADVFGLCGLGSELTGRYRWVHG
jgi:hypothetical protein